MSRALCSPSRKCCHPLTATIHVRNWIYSLSYRLSAVTTCHNVNSTCTLKVYTEPLTREQLSSLPQSCFNIPKTRPNTCFSHQNCLSSPLPGAKRQLGLGAAYSTCTWEQSRQSCVYVEGKTAHIRTFQKICNFCTSAMTNQDLSHCLV